MELDKRGIGSAESHEAIEPYGQAILFGGHGSQFRGMGKDLYFNYPKARALFSVASQNLGYSLEQTCFIDSFDDPLSRTEFAQPAIVVYNQVCFDAYRDGYASGNETYTTPIRLVTGQSLGQLNAFYIAGLFGKPGTPEAFEQLVRFAKFRGKVMQEKSDELGDSGLLVIESKQGNTDLVSDLKNRVEGEENDGIHMALDINEKRFVVGGMKDNLRNYQKELRKLGIRSGISSSSSGAFHTPLMAGVGERIREYLEGLSLHECSIPVLTNTRNPAAEITDVESIIQENADLATKPVRGVAVAKFFEASNLAFAINLGQNPLAIESVSGDPRFSDLEEVAAEGSGDLGKIVIGHLIRRNKN